MQQRMSLTNDSSVLFQYPGFAVSYELGVDSVPRFDAHIEIYSEQKQVRIQWDTPYVKKKNPYDVASHRECDDGLKETTIQRTYEDLYPLKLKELY